MSQSGLKRVLFALALSVAVAVAGCEPKTTIPSNPVTKERPVVNIPPALRQRNWIGNRQEGSCVHATMISLLRWQGRRNAADYWRQKYGSGEWPEDLAAKFDKEGIRYAYVTNGDVRFLEWSCRTRRGCGITVMGGAHMVALVHLDEKWAALLDNNNVSKFTWVPRETLIAEWKASYGWAVTPIYTPAAPLPQ
jgi:hypothetical protein